MFCDNGKNTPLHFHTLLVYNLRLTVNNKQVIALYKGIILNILRLILTSLYVVISLTACSSWLPNKGIIVLDVQNNTNTVVTSQDLPKNYQLGNSEQELDKFESFCREEIRASQLDGSEELVYENIKRGIHGQVEFKKCSDKITRIYQY